MIKFSDFTPEITASPLLGEHTDEVLAELGYDADTIAKMHAEGVVVSTRIRTVRIQARTDTSLQQIHLQHIRMVLVGSSIEIRARIPVSRSTRIPASRNPEVAVTATTRTDESPILTLRDRFCRARARRPRRQLEQ